MTCYRLALGLLVGLVGLVAAFAIGQTACGDVMKTFYVAPAGDDANPGARERPLATLAGARDAVRGVNRNMTGDIVVMLAGGTYPISEPIVFDHRDSGTGCHKIVYRAADGQKPVLSGGRAIAGWQPDADGRWKASTKLSNFRQLYVDGKRAVRARGAALPGAELHGKDGYQSTAVEMAGWKNQQDIEFCYYVTWCHTRCKVRSIQREGDRAIVTMLQPHFTNAREKEGVQVNLPSYIENALELLDEPGEWYFDRAAKTVYYKPLSGQDMTKVRVVAPAVEKLVELRGTLDQPVENVHFAGITFAEAGWLLPSEIGLVDVQANFLLNWKEPMRRQHGITAVHNEQIKSPANVVCHAAKGLRFERCTFTRLGGAGIDIEFGSQGNTVSGCRFFDISGTAVQMGDVLKDDHHPDDPRKIVKNNAVVNNCIHDCCVEYMGGVGVFAGYTDGTVIARNEIRRLPYSGISVGWGWGEEDAGGGHESYYMPFKYNTPTPAGNNRMEYNHIHQVMDPLQDGGGIYTLGNMEGTVIRGNHIHDNPGVPGGIYLDEGSGFIEVTGNVVYNVRTPMNYNNRNQNRIATCKEHDNYFGIRPGGPPRAPGKLGTALACDGAGVFESVPHSDKLDPKRLTVEAWIQLDAYPGGDDPRRWIVNKNTHEFTESHYALVIDGRKVAGFLNIGGGQENDYEAYTDDVLELGRWHHLAMTYDGSVLKVYVDGREAAAKKIDKERTPGGTPLDIGRRQDGYIYFQGKIDEVRLYGRALSAEEVKKNAAATGSADSQDEVVAPGLIGHWSFDDPPGALPEVETIITKAGLMPEYRDLLEE
ncbi:MAG: right-handed parallel beta-helix repeat-containing protein [Pirellulales bacterium]|nr:right-handed parallel beta-helix repeat-containing protein [Pirellulales bacterium]